MPIQDATTGTAEAQPTQGGYLALRFDSSDAATVVAALESALDAVRDFSENAERHGGCTNVAADDDTIVGVIVGASSDYQERGLTHADCGEFIVIP